MTSGSLYNWIKAYGPDSEEHRQSLKQSNRIKQFEKELKRVTMERDILKEATVSSSEHRNTPFNHVRRCFKFQCFSWSFI